MTAMDPDEARRLGDDDWKQRLTPEQFQVLRKGATERPFTGELLGVKEPGEFRCAGCGTTLFTTDTKYESGTGWPSFWEPVSEDAVEFRDDSSLGMRRTEAVCGTCGGHLGHTFEDGPQPTGLRYCINSAALAFDPADESS